MGIQDGVDHLIRALHHLRCTLGRTDFRCLVIGSGEEQPRLEQLTSTLGLEPYVRFTGFIPDPAYIPYVLAANICVDPDPSSEYNDRSTMVKIMDYMALAKPIVAFDLPETRRSAGGAALYVTPNDELEFAKALAHLMDHPEQRRAMGALGRRRVEGELSWSCSAQSLLRAYAALSVPHKQAAAVCVPSSPEQDKC
jgi:glycosyltransferase involved in cell wall biosynthesis